MFPFKTKMKKTKENYMKFWSLKIHLRNSNCECQLKFIRFCSTQNKMHICLNDANPLKIESYPKRNVRLRCIFPQPHHSDNKILCNFQKNGQHSCSNKEKNRNNKIECERWNISEKQSQSMHNNNSKMKCAFCKREQASTLMKMSCCR